MAEAVRGGYWLASTNAILSPGMIDAKLFSHLFVGYAGVDENTYEVTIESSESILINQFTPTVKGKNGEVKTILSIAGRSDVFAKIAEQPTNRDVFITSSIAAARAGQFDGLDLQWLYPSSADEMNNFRSLISSWKEGVTREARSSNRPPLLLVATVSNLPYLQNNLQYPVAAIKVNLNWVNLVSYDFYTPTSSRISTGPSSAFQNSNAPQNSALFGIKDWMTKGLTHLPRKQIVFGIPFHGWAWKLFNANQHQVFSRADGAARGESSYQISQDGKIYYSDVKKFIATKNAPEETDAAYQIAYTYSGPTWIVYETGDTIAKKILSAKSENVLGYFAFNIAADDDVFTLASAANASW